MNKHQIDLTLLDKIFQSLTMTDPDIAELFGESCTTIRQHRVKMGYGRPELIECNICHQDKKPNCFDKNQPGVCLKCRNGTGMKERNGHGGRPFGKAKTMWRKCPCGRKYETERAYRITEDSKIIYLDKPLNYICPRCNKIARYIGTADEHYAQGVRI